MPLINDPEIVRQQYATDKSLRVRQETHEKYTVPRLDFVEWALRCYRWRGDERVLDVGCGPGNYYTFLHQQAPEIDYYAVDFLPAMIENHPYKTHLAIGDAQFLPYEDHRFDVVMANHMLYHVADIDKAIGEFRRVLKPDGVLMVATNSLNSMQELQVLMRRAIVLLTRTSASQVRAPSPASDLFALENGARTLSRHFYSVVRYDLPSMLVFPDIEPVMAYLESTRSIREPQLPDDVLWDDVMMIMRQQITHLFNHLGELVINKLTGVLFATDRGGEIRTFVERHEASTN